jgi:hypothetical protein
MRTHAVRILLAASLAGLCLSSRQLEAPVEAQAQANPCGMQRNDAPVIFCDTFDAPYPVNSRAGQLDSLVWGVSRLTGRGTEWRDSTLDGCNGPQPASAIGATDVIICNGQLRTSSNDNHDVSVMALYPKQPFDWAGRTGTVSFDVTNDTSGGHGAWPEFWITDLPIPAPYAHLNPCDTCSFGRFAVGLRFAGDRGSCGTGWRADEVYVVRDWVLETRNIFERNSSGTRIEEKGCAQLSSGPNGGLNHVEVRISQNRIDVYASDAGSKALKLINTVTSLNLPASFTKGLIWVGDYHYAAFKAHDMNPAIPDQTNHTYTWDNVAFDGPATYRDYSYDVLDKAEQVELGLYRIGWETSPSAPLDVQTANPMSVTGLSAATRAYLLFNYQTNDQSRPSSFAFAVNGNASGAANPNPVSSYLGWRAMALEVPLSHLAAGARQRIRLAADRPARIQNVNVVLIAAAPVPGAGTPPPPPPPAEVCGDGIDNDLDGQIDEGCAPPPPPPVEVCGDGVDNDKDGLVDEGCPVVPPVPSCNVSKLWEVVTGEATVRSLLEVCRQ